MPAIKLKKVTAEYLAEKEKEEREEKSKGKSKKTLEDVADEENTAKEGKEEEEDEVKVHNFLDVEILSDKRKRVLPVVEQKLVEWLDSNLQKKEAVSLPLLILYEYYSEVCQTQGENVVDIPVFNRYIRDKYGKSFGFQENSPYRVLIKERKIKEKKPKVQGETLQIKIRDIISDVINELGNPRKGLRFQVISKAIVQKYPAQRVDIYPSKLKNALERGVMYGFIERMRGVGMCGYYRVPGEPTKEDPEDAAKEKKKKVKTEETKTDDEEAKENGEVGDSEEKSTDDEKKAEEKADDDDDGEDKDKETKPEKKRKRKQIKKKWKPEDKWARRASKHSEPERVEDVFPLAITYQSDPKEASGSRIKTYISQYYHKDVGNDRLKKALENGEERGMWELTAGTAVTGRYHLLIDSFNPGRSEKLEDQIAQALVACHEPKQASAGLIKKYVSEYHPTFNVENKPHIFRHALEKACDRGTLRQLSGIGASGTFQLLHQFFPSPAILAGDSSDEEEEDDYDDSDDEVAEYVPRPTKKGRLAKRVPARAPEPVKRGKPKSRSAPARKGKERGAKSKSSKYNEVSEEDESEEEEEVEEKVEYKAKPTKSRRSVATPAKKAPPVQDVKSTSKSKGKSATSAKKDSGKPKRAAAKTPAIIESDGSEEDEAPVEYSPRPSKSRGGGSATKQSTAGRSTSKSRTPVKRKLVEVSDADDESDVEETPPKTKQRGKSPAQKPKASSRATKRRR